ncbi:type II CAAX prenyl endopeptidase Rce1 family protein [Leptobacterium sp. I13]|uniref:CPBP family glutamic-type intramembrane protease n=1 Tax=Leptobacterium meishanense TaxID=3128904 RepID=UPI0030EE69C1
MKKYLKVILIYTFIGFLPDILNGISELFFETSISFDNEEVQGMSLIEIVFLTIIVGPVIETLIFQALLIWGLLKVKFLRNNEWMLILICGLVFGLSHGYSTQHIVFATYGGVILAHLYIKMFNLLNHKKAILITTMVHLLRNLLIFIMVDLLKLF